MVVLESIRGGVVSQAQTDSQGKFAFPQIDQDVYIVTVRHPGYRETSERIDLTMVPTANVIIDLQPLPREGPPPRPGGEAGFPVTAEELAAPEEAKTEFEKGRKLLFEDKQPGESIPHFQKAIKMHSPYASAYAFLGVAQMDLHKWKDAETALGKAIELNNKLATAHLALGACLNMQGNYAAAEKPLLRGLELTPETPDGHYELGRAYWALGRWQDAEPHARKALELRSDFAAAHLLMGNVLLRKRDAPAALQEFREYLRLEPNGPFAPPTRAVVAKIEQALATPH